MEHHYAEHGHPAGVNLQDPRESIYSEKRPNKDVPYIPAIQFGFGMLPCFSDRIHVPFETRAVGCVG